MRNRFLFSDGEQRRSTKVAATIPLSSSSRVAAGKKKAAPTVDHAAGGYYVRSL